jgi:translation initiation factor 2B subunit (eIF-2B alpha/beta/delta family)
MKITHEQIINLVKQNPNDASLGKAIRELVNTQQNANEVYIDPVQINLLDSINEVTNNGHGNRY